MRSTTVESTAVPGGEGTNQLCRQPLSGEEKYVAKGTTVQNAWKATCVEGCVASVAVKTGEQLRTA